MLDQRDMTLVRGSFISLSAHGVQFMELFYSYLFDQFPYIRPMFKDHEMGGQRIAFLGVLSFLVQSGDSPAVRKTLADLGARHDSLGVQPGHYPAVVDSLLAAAAEVQGDLWTPEVRSAWTAFLTFVVTTMLDPSLR